MGAGGQVLQIKVNSSEPKIADSDHAIIAIDEDVAGLQISLKGIATMDVFQAAEEAFVGKDDQVFDGEHIFVVKEAYMTSQRVCKFGKHWSLHGHFLLCVDVGESVDFSMSSCADGWCPFFWFELAFYFGTQSIDANRLVRQFPNLLSCKEWRLKPASTPKSIVFSVDRPLALPSSTPHLCLLNAGMAFCLN